MAISHATPVKLHMDGTASTQLQTTVQLLKDIRQVKIDLRFHGSDTPKDAQYVSIGADQRFLHQIKSVASALEKFGHGKEADALMEVYDLGITSIDFGGLGMQASGQEISEQDHAELLFLLSAHLESINSIERAKAPVQPLTSRPVGRRGMTLSEKIFAAHDVNRTGEVRPGDMIRVDVDWIMASELSWLGMEYWYDRMGKPEILRNDRFWLAGDHIVDPRIIHVPKVKAYVDAAERAKQQFKMTDNQGMNYTIMHTEFCRERAQPGMLVLGSDSHTCSGGSMSCLAVGLGMADVVLPLITGETWFKVPETVEIRFVNRPKAGIGGKDVILYILRELKRNTVAAERVVEYTGPGVKYLSCDARFAIANMTTEFGGVTGVFVPDAITQQFINRRKKPRHRAKSVYFRPDEDAEYVESHTIDLAQVESFIARYPKPDDVVPVAEMAGIELHGCFIGACTTAEEDLVLAALVLEQALKRGATPVKGKQYTRKVVPGSLPILHKLRKTGLAEIYEQAGWEIGVPSCSYCVGVAADKAKAGEVWLTSQNRNFENRMGAGAFGNLASAVTVAASSFDMKITDPAPLLDAIDMDRVYNILGARPGQESLEDPVYVEPGVQEMPTQPILQSHAPALEQHTEGDLRGKTDNDRHEEPSEVDSSSAMSSVIIGKALVLPDFVDTDALAPSEPMSQPGLSMKGFGEYCLYHTHPEFRQQVKDGQNIVVAGEAFGCGSSREQAVWALQGAGVQCVIAKSFAFIYARNQPNLGLLGFEIKDPEFHKEATNGKTIRIDLDRSVAEVNLHKDIWKSFPFQLSTMQRRLLDCGGAEKAFSRYGRSLWQALTAPSATSDSPAPSKNPSFPILEAGTKSATEW